MANGRYLDALEHFRHAAQQCRDALQQLAHQPSSEAPLSGSPYYELADHVAPLQQMLVRFEERARQIEHHIDSALLDSTDAPPSLSGKAASPPPALVRSVLASMVSHNAAS